MPVQPKNPWKLFMFLYVRGWKVLLAAMLTVFSLTYLVMESRPVQYAAEVAIQVIPVDQAMDEERFLAQVAAPFAAELFSLEILGETVDELGLDNYLGVTRERAIQELSDHTRIYWQRGELSCRVQVSSDEARLSIQLANALARAFVRSRIQDLLLSNLPESPDLGTLTAVAESLGGKDLLVSLPAFRQDADLQDATAKMALLESLSESMQAGKVSEVEKAGMDGELRQLRVQIETRKEQILAGLQKDRTKLSRPSYRIEIIQEAVAPAKAEKGREPMVYFLVGILTLAVTSCWLYLFSVLDRRIYSVRDLEKHGVNFSYLGTVPRVIQNARMKGVKELIAWHGTKTDLDDCFRYLRVAINFVASPSTLKVIPVTSGMPGEGKTFVACHLAASMAFGRNRTLLVDADFQKPELHQIFEVKQEKGLSDFLTGSAAWESLIVPSGISQLDLMTAGTRCREARSLFESEKMREFLEAVKKRYDRIMLHGPSMDRGGFELTRQVGHFVLVGQVGRITAEILRHVEHLTGPTVRALGLILNHQASTPAELSYESYMYQLKIMPPEESL